MVTPQQVMIIDDDADDRSFFQEAITNISPVIETRVFASGVQALALFKENKVYAPDYIFLDFNMPLMNGRECLVELRKLLQHKVTQIIILSTSDTKEDREDAFRLGAKLFLTKPNTFQELCNMLKGVLEGSFQMLFPSQQPNMSSH
ncbi:Response regulator receiver domain-containing protein [Chitinophaga terrae (ex Kim and Jung 2007)]|jgi:CheY-like chemotaxis protein|uniref:Response regulator receiver domain-containing protein n=1 Tax=Chitinophaga terrae (ex Kim and Jung 2007) TaxID=408074 RepID=A0A1H3YS67_9BACT|nr:response regulator [Chitinophaga terrae (ex Kim and Jung 2007)]MDQ0107197.1 CheY-like chemotaxis protein [Chitinophaga terrae (ex Kim and Jung 2007)]GEP88479.1 response regulator [Chitinophaga terrae (ex Kim and Jung 2007)]SEA14386.1 Response regulator receiver domain-containing protein [Chitinophaga terrae (ex Kim and Jung 2007)]